MERPRSCLTFGIRFQCTYAALSCFVPAPLITANTWTVGSTNCVHVGHATSTTYFPTNTQKYVQNTWRYIWGTWEDLPEQILHCYIITVGCKKALWVAREALQLVRKANVANPGTYIARLGVRRLCRNLTSMCMILAFVFTSSPLAESQRYGFSVTNSSYIHMYEQLYDNLCTYCGFANWLRVPV